MRILGTVVQIPARSAPDTGQDLATRHTVAAEAVGNQAARFVFQPEQQTLEKALCRGGIPAILHEDIEHDPVLVHRAPQIVQHAIDPDKHFIEVPGVSGLGPPRSEPCGAVGTKLPAPVPDVLVGHDHASFGQDQLNVTQTEDEHMIQPDGVSDDLGRKAMAGIEGGLRRQPGSLAQSTADRQPELTWLAVEGTDTKEIAKLIMAATESAGRHESSEAAHTSYPLEMMGILGSIPYWAAAVAVVAAGWASDLWIRRGGSTTLVRKSVVVFGLLLSIAALPSAVVSEVSLSIWLLSLAYVAFGIFASNL